MICKFNHDGDCCNSGAKQYMCKCKQPCAEIVPMTNADDFRASNDEELVEKLYDAVKGTVEGLLEVLGIQAEVGKIIRGESYKMALLDWLQQPAEVNND